MFYFALNRLLSLCLQLIFILGVFAVHMNFANAAFYQSQTLANYCNEYIKYIELDASANQLEAGVCSGYVASTIELMDLSERLCQREKMNLDKVVQQYIKEVNNNPGARKNSATFVLVNVLQNIYACEKN